MLWLTEHFHIHLHYFLNSHNKLNDLCVASSVRVGGDPLDHSAQPLPVTEEEIDGGGGRRGDVSKVTQLVNDRFEIPVQIS